MRESESYMQILCQLLSCSESADSAVTSDESAAAMLMSDSSSTTLDFFTQDLLAE